MWGGVWITHARELAGIEVAELASRIGIEARQISEWELGHEEVPYATMVALVKACGYTFVAHLEPDDGTDWTLFERSLLMTPEQRIRQAAAVSRLFRG